MALEAMPKYENDVPVSFYLENETGKISQQYQRCSSLLEGVRSRIPLQGCLSLQTSYTSF